MNCCEFCYVYVSELILFVKFFSKIKCIGTYNCAKKCVVQYIILFFKFRVANNVLLGGVEKDTGLNIRSAAKSSIFSRVYKRLTKSTFHNLDQQYVLYTPTLI